MLHWLGGAKKGNSQDSDEEKDSGKDQPPPSWKPEESGPDHEAQSQQSLRGKVVRPRVGARELSSLLQPYPQGARRKQSSAAAEEAAARRAADVSTPVVSDSSQEESKTPDKQQEETIYPDSPLPSPKKDPNMAEQKLAVRDLKKTRLKK